LVLIVDLLLAILFITASHLFGEGDLRAIVAFAGVVVAVTLVVVVAGNFAFVLHDAASDELEDKFSMVQSDVNDDEAAFRC